MNSKVTPTFFSIYCYVVTNKYESIEKAAKKLSVYAHLSETQEETKKSLPFIEFARGMVANKEDWNKFVMTAKMVSDPEIQDVAKFISNWCGLGGNTPGFAFQ